MTPPNPHLPAVVTAADRARRYLHLINLRWRGDPLFDWTAPWPPAMHTRVRWRHRWIRRGIYMGAATATLVWAAVLVVVAMRWAATVAVVLYVTGAGGG